jgi:hypothetical protein
MNRKEGIGVPAPKHQKLLPRSIGLLFSRLVYKLVGGPEGGENGR